MENNKKFNKHSVVSLILIILGVLLFPLFVILESINIYIPITINWVWYTIVILMISGFIFSIISLVKIKKSGEKGKGLAISTIIIFIIVSLFVFYLFLNSISGHPKRPNSSIKANLANIRAEAELFYDSNGSFSNLCNTNEYRVFNTIQTIEKITSVKCFSNNDSFVVVAELESKPKENDLYYGYDYLCIDSLGSMESITTLQNDSIVNANTPCPLKENQ